MEKIKIMIADDHPMIREGLKQLLELDGNIEVIAEANDGEECLEILKTVSPEVLLLDINMPNKNGMEVLESIKKQNISTKVLILTVHNEIEYLLKAMEIGIDGYILKDSDSDELKRAIEIVLTGNTYIQPSLIPEMNKGKKEYTIDSNKIRSLTRREVEVLNLIAGGCSNRKISEELSISERTVKNHISHIFKKIDVEDRTQAAVFIMKNDFMNH